MMNSCLFSPVSSLTFNCLQIDWSIIFQFASHFWKKQYISFLPRASPQFSRTATAISERASDDCLSKNLTNPYSGFVRIQSWNSLVSDDLKASSLLKYSYAVTYRYCLGCLLTLTLLKNANPKILNLYILSIILSLVTPFCPVAEQQFPSQSYSADVHICFLFLLMYLAHFLTQTFMCAYITEPSFHLLCVLLMLGASETHH